VNVDNLVATSGYWAVFALVAAESLGVPLPGETALIAAGTYAGTSHHLSPWLLFVVAAAAAIVGDNIGYWIGDLGGYRLLRRFGHYLRLDQKKIKVARYIFDRYGARVVLFGRFVAILRTYAAFLAGTSRMRWRTFLLANAIGGILWSGIFTGVSYAAGTTLEHLSLALNIGLGVVALAVIVVAFALLRRHLGRLTERAEAAYPGSLDNEAVRR